MVHGGGNKISGIDEQRRKVLQDGKLRQMGMYSNMCWEIEQRAILLK